MTEELIAAVGAVLEPVETLRTERAGHAIELAREARAEAIVVFSGDGGFNEVLNGVRPGVAVGFVPGGGTSVLPRALGLPRDPRRRRSADRVRPHSPDLARPRERPPLRLQRRRRASTPS